MAMTASHSGPQELSETSVYVYGVTWSDGVRRSKAGGVKVEAIEHGDLAAVVSRGPDGPVRAKRRELMRLLDVLQDLFATATVLPLRFGCVFPGPDVVADELLSDRYDEL